GFIEKVTRASTIHAARRGVDEPPDPRLASQLRQPDRAQMIDLESDLGIVLSQRVIGQLGQVHHGVAARQILGRHVTQILVERSRAIQHCAVIAIEPAIAVVAGVQPQNLVACRGQEMHQPRADVTVAAGNEYLHGANAPLYIWFSERAGIPALRDPTCSVSLPKVLQAEGDVTVDFPPAPGGVHPSPAALHSCHETGEVALATCSAAAPAFPWPRLVRSPPRTREASELHGDRDGRYAVAVDDEEHVV